jgi:hypothetical protein
MGHAKSLQGTLGFGTALFILMLLSAPSRATGEMRLFVVDQGAGTVRQYSALGQTWASSQAAWAHRMDHR